jgi:hypothetical protein
MKTSKGYKNIVMSLEKSYIAAVNFIDEDYLCNQYLSPKKLWD